MHPYSDSTDRLKIYIYIAIISAIITPKLNNQLVALEFLKDFEPWISSSLSFTVVFTVLYQCFKHVLWRYKPIRKIAFLSIDNLNGIYRGELISSFKDADGNNVKVDLELNIQQDWTSIQIYMKTGSGSSTSQSIMANMCAINERSTRLIYYYTNTPLNEIADEDMFQHDGTANLIFNKDGTVEGNYFNGKLRKGSIKLSKIETPSKAIK